MEDREVSVHCAPGQEVDTHTHPIMELMSFYSWRRKRAERKRQKHENMNFGNGLIGQTNQLQNYVNHCGHLKAEGPMLLN